MLLIYSLSKYENVPMTPHDSEDLKVYNFPKDFIAI